jgi:hypothetical protein
VNQRSDPRVRVQVVMNLSLFTLSLSLTQPDDFKG